MRLLSSDGLKERGIVFSKTQLYRLVKAGKFPQTVQIGFKRRAWVESEVDDWIKERVKERDQGAA